MANVATAAPSLRLVCQRNYPGATAEPLSIDRHCYRATPEYIQIDTFFNECEITKTQAVFTIHRKALIA